LTRLFIAQAGARQAQHDRVWGAQRLRRLAAQGVEALAVFQAVRRRTIAVVLTNERAAVRRAVGRTTGRDVTNPDESPAARQRERVLAIRARQAGGLTQRALAVTLALGQKMPAFRVQELAFAHALAANAGRERQQGEPREQKSSQTSAQCRHHYRTEDDLELARASNRAADAPPPQNF
jgi:hypothetical protein